MAVVELPAYCPTCRAIFRSGIVLDNCSNITMGDNVAGPCPNGHMGLVMDGTFDAMNGILSIRDAGPVSRSVLQKIREIAERAATGKADPASSLNQIIDLLPPASAAAVKKLGAKNPIVTILILLACINYGSGIASNATTAYRNIFPSTPVPAPVVEHHVTFSNHLASGQGSNGGVAKPLKREQIRRLKQMRAKHEKRPQAGSKDAEAEGSPRTEPRHD